MYKSLRPWLFRVPPETAHEAALLALRVFGALHRPSVAPVDGPLAVHVLGLRFANPLGLAAGFDKNGRALRGLAHWRLNHLNEAIVDLRDAAKRLPNRPDVYYNLALVLEADHKRADARSAADHALHLAPTDSAVRELSERLRR